MLDAPLRAAIGPTVERAARRLHRVGVPPLALTLTGFGCGAAACVAVGFRAWGLGLVLWLLNRALDGLDGAVARVSGRTSALGGFLDLVADFTVYGGFVIAIAIAVPDARIACLVLLGAYYVSGTAFLTLSSLIERHSTDRGGALADERSLRFVGGLAEGTETIGVYVLFCLFPAAATVIAWVFAAAVLITAGQRIAAGIRILGSLDRS